MPGAMAKDINQSPVTMQATWYRLPAPKAPVVEP
jgi:hypothetical protein